MDYNPHDAFHQGHQPLLQAIDETLQSDEAVPYYEQAVAHYKEVVRLVLGRLRKEVFAN